MKPFEDLKAHYPSIIDQMPDRFNSHHFIKALAREHQGLYIQALAQYVDNKAPFQIVHRQLAQMLNRFDALVEHAGEEPSEDIFGNSNSASVWAKR